MNRLDKELVILNLAPTRSKAQELIKTGCVKVNNKIILKPSLDISSFDSVEIIDTTTLKYVSRAGLKLEKAIKVFNIDFYNKNVMDIGSSTGGFTDCALQNGAASVIAVDVGTNLMVDSLRNNPKVTLFEQTNIKDLPSKYFKDVDITVIDVSFVSLSKIFEKIFSEQIKVDIMALIKPQFECGKQIADKFKGVISSPAVHKQVIEDVISMARDFGFTLNNLDFSAIKGGDGNIEYISHFTNRDIHSTLNDKVINIDLIIKNAFNSLK